jgi:N-acetylmuramoyl-L-alanine amidase
MDQNTENNDTQNGAPQNQGADDRYRNRNRDSLFIEYPDEKEGRERRERKELEEKREEERWGRDRRGNLHIRNPYDEDDGYEDADGLPSNRSARIGGSASARFWINVAAFALIVIVIAFGIFLKFRWNTAPSPGGPKNPHSGQSEIQKKIDALDWVTEGFLPINRYSRPGTQLGEVNAIVIHYIGNPGTSAEQNRGYFAGREAAGGPSVSSNFIVGLEGEIIQCVPVDEVAYASNNRNADTLSIEMCHPDETGVFTEATYASAVRLTAWLCAEYGLGGDDIIRHYDITGKECPKYFVEDEAAWEAFKAAVASVSR